jgi:hypothetical protein
MLPSVFTASLDIHGCVLADELDTSRSILKRKLNWQHCTLQLDSYTQGCLEPTVTPPALWPFITPDRLTGATETMQSSSNPGSVSPATCLNLLSMLDGLCFTTDVLFLLRRNLHQHRVWWQLLFLPFPLRGAMSVALSTWGLIGQGLCLPLLSASGALVCTLQTGWMGRNPRWDKWRPWPAERAHGGEAGLARMRYRHTVLLQAQKRSQVSFIVVWVFKTLVQNWSHSGLLQGLGCGWETRTLGHWIFLSLILPLLLSISLSRFPHTYNQLSFFLFLFFKSCILTDKKFCTKHTVIKFLNY